MDAFVAVGPMLTFMPKAGAGEDQDIEALEHKFNPRRHRVDHMHIGDVEFAAVGGEERLDAVRDVVLGRERAPDLLQRIEEENYLDVVAAFGADRFDALLEEKRNLPGGARQCGR